MNDFDSLSILPFSIDPGARQEVRRIEAGWFVLFETQLRERFPGVQAKCFYVFNMLNLYPSLQQSV